MRYLLGRRPGTVWPWVAIGLLLEVAFLSSCGSSSEAQPMLPERTIPPDATFVEAPQPKELATIHPKLDSTLNQLLEAYDHGGMAEAQAFAETRGMVLQGQGVQVIIVTSPDAVDGLAEAIEPQGGEVQGHFEGQVQALVPIEALASLAELPEVQRIREPQRVVP
jgi:hypothetical protein